MNKELKEILTFTFILLSIVGIGFIVSYLPLFEKTEYKQVHHIQQRKVIHKENPKYIM